jgi:fructoselysine 6-kinase
MRWAHSRGPEVVVVTQGERGGAFFDGTTITRVPAAPTRVVDTLGAGDAFIGGVLHGLLAGAHPHVFLARAAALAARVCQSWGGFGHGVPLALQSESAASPAGVPCTSQLA